MTELNEDQKEPMSDGREAKIEWINDLYDYIEELAEENTTLTRQCDALRAALERRLCDYECNFYTCPREPFCADARQVITGQPNPQANH